MGIYCTQCEERVRGGIDDFKDHMNNSRHPAPFLCEEDDCARRKFLVKSSFVRHLIDHHPTSCLPSEESGSVSVSASTSASISGSASTASNQSNLSRQHTDQEDEGNSESRSLEDTDGDGDAVGSSESDNEQESDLQRNLENSAARMILNLRRTGNVTETAMSKFICETEKLMQDTAQATQRQVINNLLSAGVNEETIRQTTEVKIVKPFKNLKKNDKQMKYFEENFNLVQPTAKLIGDRFDERLDRDTGNILPVQVPVTFQYISAKKTLSAVLNNKVLFDQIHSESPSSDGKMRSFLDGAFAKEHPLIKEYPNTIRIVLYIDDFECANPLGSKAGPHKITAVYFLIDNLPAEENSRLRSIHLLAYAYRDDLPLDTLVDVLLEPFFEELRLLETEEGVTILVEKKDFTLRATLIAISADTLAAHELLGLLSSSARRFCAHCLITKSDLHRDILALGEMRSKVTHLIHLHEMETRGNLVAQKEYSVKRNAAMIFEPKFTDFPYVYVRDGMHDVLKGIGPMEMKLVLREHCVVKKFYTVEYFNNSLKSFNYGTPDVKNKPSPNISQESLTGSFSYNLKQSAAQTWCLLRIFPFLVASKVPVDDPHLRLIVLLKRVTEIIFSDAVSENDLLNLDRLLKDHHSLFLMLYPPPNNENVNERNEGQLDDQVELEDFLMEEETRDNPDAPPPVARQRGPRVIRPLLKHHYMLHYVEIMRRVGPAVRYWCMRFEGKHAIAKKYAMICCNYKNLPLTLAKIHQINHCADLLDVKAVKSQVSSSRKSIRIAGETDYFEALQAKGFHADDVLSQVNQVTVGGFSYSVGLHVVLPMTVNDSPLFGLIKCIYLHNDNVFLVTEDCQVAEYSERFGAYRVREDNYEHCVRTFSASIFCNKPIMAWNVGNVTFLSPRCNLVDVLFDPNDEAQI